MTQIRIFPDSTALSTAAAALFMAAAKTAVSQNGRFLVALSGGSTPLALFQQLRQPAYAQIPWQQTHVFWGDERLVLPTDPGSNYGQAYDALLRHVPIPAAHIHRAKGELEAAAAVADYRPKIVANEKIKKEGKTLFIELERNPDIIAEIGKKKGNRILVGFAMETQNLLTNARGKLVKKNMDMIVANNLRQEGAGFRTDTNIITVIDRAGKTESLEKMTKIDAAGAILNRIKKLISEKSKGKK